MAKKRRTPLSFSTVLGELLLVGGLGVLGYLIWLPWYAQTVVGGEQRELAASHTAQWVEADASTQGDIPVPEVGEVGEVWGVIYIPALGDDWANVIAEGVGRPDPLDVWNKGIGHYPTTQVPGETGNVALAAHRNGPTSPFRDLEYLRTGDPIYIETPDGWYTYTFRNDEVVTPDTVQVLEGFPYFEGRVGDDGMLTLTSCYPKNGAAYRIISFASFDDFTPRSDGPPDALAALHPNLAQEV